MSTATELVLVRHGETEWNRARRIQGHIDIPLSEVGHRQASATGRRLAAEAIDAVYTSDLSRARQTAEAIARAVGLPLVEDARLRERAYGHFEGKDHDTLQRLHADDHARWKRRDPHFALPGGGESLAVFQARVEGVLAELAARHVGGRLVVVAHGGVLDAAWRLAAGLPVEAPRAVDLLNASLNRLRWHPGVDGTGPGRFALVDWADVRHLDASLDDVEPMAP